MNQQTLNLRDIHLPEPISWWPLAPGWWLLLVSVLLILCALYLTIKIYRSRQLKRDIKAELEHIKQQFQQTQSKSQLAKSLSILLRRASISYYPKANIAGLTGEHWLTYLDKTNIKRSEKISFKTNAGKILLSAPYLPENKKLDFDAQFLIDLCESWLLAPHKKMVVEPEKITGEPPS
jgi:uncharacterized protein DUF4381